MTPVIQQQTITNASATVNAAVVLKLLMADIEISEGYEAYDERLFVEVPGGGDWSSTTLVCDEDVPLQLTFKIRPKVTQ